MIDSTPLTVVVDQSPAGTTQSIVEADAGSQAEKALQYALLESGQGASSVTLQGEDILAGSEDGFDALPKRGKMRSLSRLVFAPGSDHGGVKIVDRRGELPARIALVAQQDLSSFALTAFKESQPDLPFIFLRRGDLKGPGGAVGGEDGVQADSPEVAGVRGAVAVVADVGKSGAERRLPASSALDRGRVDEQEVVGETGALLGKDDQEPAEIGGEPAAALEVAGLAGDAGKQMHERFLRPSKETPVRRLAHDGLGHREGDDLGIGGASARVASSSWQKIIGCAINEGAESVEVGVHRGLQADGVSDTADFGLSASNPFLAAIFVESII
jgi:hypothetical protein